MAGGGLAPDNSYTGAWVTFASQLRDEHPLPGPANAEAVSNAFGIPSALPSPAGARVERRWQSGGLTGEEISWSVGYGPRTRAWVLRPEGAEPCPGVVALHCHGGFKYYGKEKIADAPPWQYPGVGGVREAFYSGRAFANELALTGFVVLVHDTFSWGSRRFPLAEMPEPVQSMADAIKGKALGGPVGEDVTEEIALYNAAAWLHEHAVEKYCRLLGTTMAAVVAYEDRVAVSYLESRPDVLPGGVGCVGLSGGGCRSALLHATDQRVRAAVVVGMMSTYAGLFRNHVAGHTWMFFPEGWAGKWDWPALAGVRAPSPLLVQYDRDDELFTLRGMLEAHDWLKDRYRQAGGGYTGLFYDGPHKFDALMQQDAFDWLRRQLAD